MGQHRQRGLFCDLSADRWQSGCPDNWKQEARLLSNLRYPNSTIAVKTSISDHVTCRDPPVFINPVLIHIIAFWPVPAGFLFHIWVKLSFLENCRLRGSLWGWTGADLDGEVLVCFGLVYQIVLLVWRLVLVNSGLLHWDLLHWAVIIWRWFHLILVLRLLPSAFGEELSQRKKLLCHNMFGYDLCIKPC